MIYLASPESLMLPRPSLHGAGTRLPKAMFRSQKAIAYFCQLAGDVRKVTAQIKCFYCYRISAHIKYHLWILRLLSHNLRASSPPKYSRRFFRGAAIREVLSNTSGLVDERCSSSANNLCVANCAGKAYNKHTSWNFLACSIKKQ